MKLELPDFIFLAIVGTHLILCPYTKVEESFNIQAIHDIYTYGITNIGKYDHLEFPGAVPRTFVGSLFISFLTKLFCRVAPPPEGDLLFVQTLARVVLSAFNAFSLATLRQSIKWSYDIGAQLLERDDQERTKTEKKEDQKPVVHSTPWGLSSSAWFWALMCIQFHIPFYVSRTIPNFLAFPFTNIALSYIIELNYSAGLGLLAFTAIVFRSEVALLMCSIALTLLVFRQTSIKKMFRPIVIGTVMGLISSALVDSYFWQKPLMVPEIQGFIYNVIQGKSSNWGVSPYEQYFLQDIPKVINFGGPVVWVFMFFGLISKDITPSKTTTILGISSLIYVAVYSMQPHKEWRFIVYVIPILTLLTAKGISVISTFASKYLGRLIHNLFIIMTLIIMAIGLGLSTVRLVVSSMNYEGGVALAKFHELVPNAPNPVKGEPLVVHFDVPVAMSGATRFGQLYSEVKNPEYNPWYIYDKTEDKDTLEDILDSFDYLIVETSPEEVEKVYPLPSTYKWKLMDKVERFDHINQTIIKNTVREATEDVKFVEAYFESLIKGEKIPDNREVKLFNKIKAYAQKSWNEKKSYTDFAKEVTLPLFKFINLREAVWIYKRVSVTDPTEMTNDYPWNISEDTDREANTETIETNTSIREDL